ncbi:MAG: type II toxin-antitoxin system Phd/YefM family antitoxin [Caldilineaceae bacterium]
MALRVSDTQVRTQLSVLWDEIIHNREVVIIHRKGVDDIAMIAADELRSLLETVHLVRSLKNSERLLTALARAAEGSVQPQSIEQFRCDLGLDDGE